MGYYEQNPVFSLRCSSVRKMLACLGDYDLVPSSSHLLEGRFQAGDVGDTAPVSGRCSLGFSLIIVRKLGNDRLISETSL